MKVLRAKHMGYCMGVQGAVQAAERALQTENKLYSHGPLIHNQQEINRLQKAGLKQLDGKEEDLSHASVLIRAHGIHPLEKQKLKDEGANIIDATCPLVLRNQKRVKLKDKEGYQIIIAGHLGHAEIKALVGFSQQPIVIETPQQAEELNLNAENPLFLLAQTTLRPAVFEEIEKIIRLKVPNVEVFNSICMATQERQQAVKELTSIVDVVIIVGDKGSANSIGLVETVKSLGKPAYLIASADDIQSEIYQYETVGLTAAASAPSWLIDEIEQALVKNCS